MQDDNKSNDNIDQVDEHNNQIDIETLVLDYGNDILRTAYMYVKDKDVAEDIFQDVFVKVNRNLDTFRGDSSIKTWLIRITINTSKDYLKSAWKRRVFPVSDFHESKLTSEDDFKKIEDGETHNIVRDAVMDLPRKHKDVILCVYFLDMTIKETATSLGIKEGTVKSRLSRAKGNLRMILNGRL